MSEVEQARITELRGVVSDLVATVRLVLPELARQPFREQVAAVALRGEQALQHREPSEP